MLPILYMYFDVFQIDRLTESFDVIADLLKSHHHGNSPLDPDASEDQGDPVQHRLVYIGISVFMTKLLKALVPVEKVRLKALLHKLQLSLNLKLSLSSKTLLLKMVIIFCCIKQF